MTFGSLKHPLRFWLRLFFMVVWTALWVPFLYSAAHFQWPFHNWLLRRYCGGTNWIMGLKVKVHGHITKDRPVLFVSNHCSYFDIYALAATLPGVFLAKDEILGWPGLGVLAPMSGSVFISRNPQKTRENIERIKNSPSNAFILFPEGTTTDGNRVQKFNSAFFSLVEQLGNGKPAIVQPVSIAYTRLAGIPMGSHYRPYFSWFGDMTLAAHVQESLAFSSVTAEITIHHTIEGESLRDRKKLAQLCEQLIAGSVADSLTTPKKSKEKAKKPDKVAA